MALTTKLEIRIVPHEVAKFRAAIRDLVLPELRELRESIDQLTQQLTPIMRFIDSG